MESCLRLGDCLEVMKEIPDGSVDMILCDLPYGITHNKLDITIPFEPLWKQYKRTTKETAAIVLFGSGMFTADLMKSNLQMWRYNLIWDKVLTSGFLNANRQPLRCHEDICVFYRKQPIYNPQKTVGEMNHSQGTPKSQKTNNNYGEHGFADNRAMLGTLKHPRSIVTFQKPHPSISVHPTQKPVELLEWLILTYTNEGAVVMDNCMGSGSTCVACVNTGRKYIGIEKEPKYFEVACERIEEAENESLCSQ